MTDRCFYFGCWNQPGHYLVAPGGRRTDLTQREAYELPGELDAQLAPKQKPGGPIVFGDTSSSRDWTRYGATECPQGQFLRHRLKQYTVIQWWDRAQGDKRSNCNSSILLEGAHTSEEMLRALAEHFPHVLANLEKAGIRLVEVHLEPE